MAKRFFTIASGSFVIVEETPSEHGGGQTHVHIELLHNLLSGISCSFVDTIGLSRVNLCIKKGGIP